MRKRLSQRFVETLKPKSKPYQIHDTVLPGLIARVQPTGRVYWKLIVDRKPHGLGVFPAMTAGMAQEAAKRLLSGEEEQQAKVPTLNRFIRDHYAAYVEAHHSRPSETLSYLRAFGFGGKKLGRIGVADLETWRLAQIRKGRSPRTINRNAATLKACLQRAVDWELLDSNPLARLKPLKVDRRPVVRYLTPQEETRMLAALETATPWLKALTITALNTGLRRNELWNLAWADIDFRRDMLTVHGTGAKSGQTRHVPLNRTARSALLAWKGDAAYLPAVKVFDRHEFKKSWRTLLRKADIEAFRFHDTRHHFASKLVMTGVALNTCRELLGHASLDMTLIYAHLAPDNMKSAVDLIG